MRKLILVSFGFKTCFLVLSLSLISYKIHDSGNEYKLPKNSSSVFSCDIDKNGNNDIIAGHSTDCGYSNPSVSILKNNGFGIFYISDTSITFPGTQYQILAINLNNDTFPDIITKTTECLIGGQQYFRIFYNNGQGIFNSYQDFSLNSNNSNNVVSIYYGDLNDDQYLDILVAFNGGGNTKKWGVLYNNGQGYLLPPVYYDLSFYPLDIKVSDLNGDGRDDVVVAGQDPVIYYSYTSGFQTMSLSSNLIDKVQIADLNQDGYKDIIGIFGLFFNTTLVYVYDGSQNFTLNQLPSLPFGSNQFVISELNNDSLPDLVLLSFSLDGIYILYNQGNFTFSSSVFIPVPYENEMHRYINCSDLDNNGFNDISMTRWGGPFEESNNNNLILLFNDGEGNFGPDPLTNISKPPDPGNDLLTIFPNPFHKMTSISFVINYQAEVELIVYDCEGRLIQILTNKSRAHGYYSFTWDCSDKDRYTEGVYIIVLKTGNKTICSKKVIKFGSSQ